MSSSVFYTRLGLTLALRLLIGTFPPFVLEATSWFSIQWITSVVKVCAVLHHDWLCLTAWLERCAVVSIIIPAASRSARCVGGAIDVGLNETIRWGPSVERRRRWCGRRWWWLLSNIALCVVNTVGTVAFVLEAALRQAFSTSSEEKVDNGVSAQSRDEENNSALNLLCPAAAVLILGSKAIVWLRITNRVTAHDLFGRRVNKLW